jgi:hypothetical protein
VSDLCKARVGEGRVRNNNCWESGMVVAD